MKDQLIVLSQLQVLERQRIQLQNQKAGISAEEVRRLWQEIKLMTQNITVNREKLICLEKVCARQEDDISAITKQCEQMEAKLYGGEITNLKEMEQIKEKCETARKNLANREEEVFSNLEFFEELTARIAQEETELQNMKRRHAEKQHKMTQTIAEYEARLAQLETDCRELTGKVEAGLLGKYRELSRKMPQPVAKVEGGICGGCRRSLPTSQAAIAQAALSYCDNCGRILLID